MITSISIIYLLAWAAFLLTFFAAMFVGLLCAALFSALWTLSRRRLPATPSASAVTPGHEAAKVTLPAKYGAHDSHVGNN